MTLSFERLISALFVSLILLAGTTAQALPPPAGKVILTLSGKVSDKNGPDGASFDMAMLERLPQRSFSTQTPWYPQPVTFSGPLLRDVLAAAKASGTVLQAVALNDYKTEIPVADTQTFDVVLALKMNGELIPVRTKGPLFIIYPFDSKPELKATKYIERAAWQLKSISVQ
jgi:hypothetical protein